MLLNGKDIELLQTCPRAWWLSRSPHTIPLTLEAVQRYVATWLWTQQLRRGQKVSLFQLKQRWGLEAAKILIPGQDSPPLTVSNPIADGFLVMKEIYEEYAISPLTPVATGVPLRYTIPHCGVCWITIPVVCLGGLGETILLDYSTLTTRELEQSASAAAELLAGEELEAEILIITRLIRGLPRTHLRRGDMNQRKVERNLKAIFSLAKTKASYQAIACWKECPFKKKCREYTLFR